MPRRPGDEAEDMFRGDSGMPAKLPDDALSIEDSREWTTEREVAESGLLCR